MNDYVVEVSALIAAPGTAVWAVLTDYRHGHQAILPRPPFVSMTVLAGGLGAGTVVQVEMNVMGAQRSMRLEATEPEPGRVLRETERATGLETTFTVDPLDDGRRCRVTIATRFVPARGVQGWLERLFNPPLVRRIYRQELGLLAERVGGEGDAA